MNHFHVVILLSLCVAYQRIISAVCSPYIGWLILLDWYYGSHNCNILLLFTPNVDFTYKFDKLNNKLVIDEFWYLVYVQLSSNGIDVHNRLYTIVKYATIVTEFIAYKIHYYVFNLTTNSGSKNNLIILDPQYHNIIYNADAVAYIDNKYNERIKLLGTSVL